MLWSVAALFTILWLVSIVAGASGGAHHLLLAVAAVAVVARLRRRRPPAGEEVPARYAGSFEAYLERERMARRAASKSKRRG